MKLNELRDGQKACIMAIEGDKRYLSRITSIGLNTGCEIEMLQNVKKRPILVYGRDTTLFVLVIVAGILIACCFSLYKRFSGKQSCCGTTKEKITKKKLRNVKGQYVIKIEGMHCENCRRQIVTAINKLEGVSAKVCLEKQIAVVSYEKEVSPDEIISAIESLGFIAEMTGR